MFAMAVDEGLVNVNPARGVKRFREEKRDRFLRGDELPRFFAALTEATELIQDFVLVSLLCGARRSNVQAMKWCDIDFTTRLWRIPPEQSKNKMVVVVPLSPPVLGILERRRAAGNGSAWVLPSPRPGRAGHLVEPKRGWRAILKRAGLDDVRLHDLRRSLGSWLAISGTSMPIIGKALGHTQLKATEIYARLSLDPVAAAVEEAGNAMLAAGNGNSIVKQPQQEENSHAL
jgi:integrase